MPFASCQLFVQNHDVIPFQPCRETPFLCHWPGPELSGTSSCEGGSGNAPIRILWWSRGAHYTIHWGIGWWVTRIIKLKAISGASGIWSWYTGSRYTGSDCEIYAMFTVLLQPGVHKVDYFCSPRWPNFFYRFTAACKNLGTLRNSICVNVCINNYFWYPNRSCPCQKLVSHRQQSYWDRRHSWGLWQTKFYILAWKTHW